MDHITDNLMAYPIPESVRAVLHKIDAIAQDCARRGGDVPARIVLSASDFDTIDRIVRHASRGLHSAHGVRFNGRLLASPSRSLIAA